VIKENENGFKLPFHVAEKNIPHIDESGKIVSPKDKNGIKFETFVFDALLDTQTSISVEIDRSKEFSPLKNRSGVDSPETVHRDQLNLFAGWFEKAGFSVPGNTEGLPEYELEVSPLFADSQEVFLQRKNELPEPSDGLYLE